MRDGHSSLHYHTSLQTTIEHVPLLFIDEKTLGVTGSCYEGRKEGGALVVVVLSKDSPMSLLNHSWTCVLGTMPMQTAVPSAHC